MFKKQLIQSSKFTHLNLSNFIFQYDWLIIFSNFRMYSG